MWTLTALPDLSALTSLQTLDLSLCESLTALPDLSALTSLQTLDLSGCGSLTALPDLSALTSLKQCRAPDHLELPDHLHWNSDSPSLHSDSDSSF